MPAAMHSDREECASLRVRLDKARAAEGRSRGAGFRHGTRFRTSGPYHSHRRHLPAQSGNGAFDRGEGWHRRPYLVGAVGMVFWGRHSDKTGERKWHVVLSFAAMVIPNPVVKMAVLCIAGWGFFSVLPVFWTLPTAFLSGAGAAAGIAAVNSIGNLGGYFGPKIFGQLRDWTGTDFALSA